MKFRVKTFEKKFIDELGRFIRGSHVYLADKQNELKDNEWFGLIYDDFEQQFTSLISNWKVQKCILF
jgi:hypothetical protein